MTIFLTLLTRLSRSQKKTAKEKMTFSIASKVFKKVENLLSMLLRVDYFHQYQQQEHDLKILTPKQMLQRLLIVLAQVNAGNNSESLLNEIRQIVYSWYQSKEVTKKYTIT